MIQIICWKIRLLKFDITIISRFQKNCYILQIPVTTQLSGGCKPSPAESCYVFSSFIPILKPLRFISISQIPKSLFHFYENVDSTSPYTAVGFLYGKTDSDPLLGNFQELVYRQHRFWDSSTEASVL